MTLPIGAHGVTVNYERGRPLDGDTVPDVNTVAVHWYGDLRDFGAKLSELTRCLAHHFVHALVAAGLAAYQAVGTGGRREVQLREDVRGSVSEAVDQLRQLIEENTR